MNSYIEGTIDRIEGDNVVIVLRDQQKLLWPKDKFQAEPQEGAVLKIYLQEDGKATEKQEEKAKQFLNEILRNE